MGGPQILILFDPEAFYTCIYVILARLMEKVLNLLPTLLYVPPKTTSPRAGVQLVYKQAFDTYLAPKKVT